MMIRSRPMIVAAVLLTLPLWAMPPSAAREEEEPIDSGRADQAEAAPAGAPTSEPTAPKTYPPYRRVPRYFGQIGLSPNQKGEIYILRGRYRAEIYELERRIEELKEQEMAECQSVLTDAQVKLLEHLRDAKRSPYPLADDGDEE